MFPTATENVPICSLKYFDLCVFQIGIVGSRTHLGYFFSSQCLLSSGAFSSYILSGNLHWHASLSLTITSLFFLSLTSLGCFVIGTFLWKCRWVLMGFMVVWSHFSFYSGQMNDANLPLSSTENSSLITPRASPRPGATFSMSLFLTTCSHGTHPPVPPGNWIHSCYFSLFP